MKICRLEIQNFRGIQNLLAESLGDTIIVAGQNGSGKSCIFDAIRLLKTAYGGYSQNEWQNFFGEFSIQLHGGFKNIAGLFHDRTKPIVIDARFQLRDEERRYVTNHGRELLEESIWRTLLPEAFQFGGYSKALFSNQFRERQPEVDDRVKNELPDLLREISLPELTGRIEILSNGRIQTWNSRALSVIFSNFRPNEIGVVDFHGAQRHYGREFVQGINLNLEQGKHNYSQHALYNYNNKYSNVKSEMAGSFVRVLLAERARSLGGADAGAIGHDDPAKLTETLRDLFASFFPDKHFLGPRPTLDGGLEFPVVTATGQEHDLDELSSGEKEILYGYLRIRSSAPRYSIILLDEPELHLNPRLIRGLPEFYRKNLGETLENQLWLVTHSDTLIREAVGKPGFNVFHMLAAGAVPNEQSQLRPLKVSGEIDAVLADLVGDLAAYRPGGKGLIFEGGGDADFDKNFVGKIFADDLRGVNLISATSRERVRTLHEVLDRAYNQGDYPTKFYAITDRDSDTNIIESPVVNRFSWDVYHIENYLIDIDTIADVVNSIGIIKNYSPEDIRLALNSSARDVVDNVVQHKLRSYVNEKLVGCMDFKFDPKSKNPGSDLDLAVDRSIQKISKIRSNEVSPESIFAKEREIRNEIDQSFASGTWMKDIPGRDILRRFVSRENLQIPYEIFRNLILSKMVDRGFKPASMSAIIEKIRND